MREILFRGQRVDNEEWVYGRSTWWFKGSPNGVILQDAIRSNDGCHYKIFCETVGQFTGLCDRNGDKIYEGDIVETPEEICKVEWLDYFGCFKFRTADDDFFDMTDFIASNCNSVKVIGNVHDNPELLKGGDE